MTTGWPDGAPFSSGSRLGILYHSFLQAASDEAGLLYVALRRLTLSTLFWLSVDSRKATSRIMHNGFSV